MYVYVGIIYNGGTVLFIDFPCWQKYIYVFIPMGFLATAHRRDRRGLPLWHQSCRREGLDAGRAPRFKSQGFPGGNEGKTMGDFYTIGLFCIFW